MAETIHKCKKNPQWHTLYTEKCNANICNRCDKPKGEDAEFREATEDQPPQWVCQTCLATEKLPPGQNDGDLCNRNGCQGTVDEYTTYYCPSCEWSSEDGDET